MNHGCGLTIRLLIGEDFSDSSVGKESAYNAGDPSSISGSGRSAGEGIGYPLQYSWASLVAQLVKNLPAMWETWVGSLGQADTLEKGKATLSSILALENAMDCIVHGVAESDMTEWLSLLIGDYSSGVDNKSESKILYNNGTDEPICRPRIEMQMQRMNLCTQHGKERMG